MYKWLKTDNSLSTAEDIIQSDLGLVKYRWKWPSGKLPFTNINVLDTFSCEKYSEVYEKDWNLFLSQFKELAESFQSHSACKFEMEDDYCVRVSRFMLKRQNTRDLFIYKEWLESECVESWFKTEKKENILCIWLNSIILVTTRSKKLSFEQHNSRINDLSLQQIFH